MLVVRRSIWLVLAPAIFAAGWCWMEAASKHYQRLTGRNFYGLAAYHYSAPDDIKYLPRGHMIERWAVTIPSNTTLGLFLATAALVTVVERRSRVLLLGAWWVYYAIWVAAFTLIAFWYLINVTGVFV